MKFFKKNTVQSLTIIALCFALLYFHLSQNSTMFKTMIGFIFAYSVYTFFIKD